MPVEYVEKAAASAANYAARLEIFIDGRPIQPYTPMTVQNGKFHMWLVFGRKTEDGAPIAVLHIVEQDFQEPTFEAKQWAAREAYLARHGFVTEDASFTTGVSGQIAVFGFRNETDMPIMIMGSIMHQALWNDLSAQVHQNWYTMNEQRPQGEREELHPPYLIATKFRRLCDLEASPAAVNKFMQVDMIRMHLSFTIHGK